MANPEPLPSFPLGLVPVTVDSALEWTFIAVFFTIATTISGLGLRSICSRATPFHGEHAVHFGALFAYYVLVLAESVNLALLGFFDSTQVPPSQASIGFKAGFVRNEFYSVTNGLVKISILMFLIRLFGVSRPFYYTACTLSLFSIAWSAFDFSIIPNVCHPASAWWSGDDDYYYAHCDDPRRGKYQAISSVVNFAIELGIFLLPLPVIVRLNTTKVKKAKFALLLSFGLATIIVALVSAVCLILQYIADAGMQDSVIPKGVLYISRYRFVLETGVALCVSAALCFRSSLQHTIRAAVRRLHPRKPESLHADARSDSRSSEQGFVLKDYEVHVHGPDFASRQAHQQSSSAKSVPGLYTRMLGSLFDTRQDEGSQVEETGTLSRGDASSPRSSLH